MPCPYSTGPYRPPITGFTRVNWIHAGERTATHNGDDQRVFRGSGPKAGGRIVMHGIRSSIAAGTASPTLDPIARLRLRALRCVLRHDLHASSGTATLSRCGRQRSTHGCRATGLTVLGRAPDPFSVRRARRVRRHAGSRPRRPEYPRLSRWLATGHRALWPSATQCPVQHRRSVQGGGIEKNQR
jgi:hypothetical protein